MQRRSFLNCKEGLVNNYELAAGLVSVPLYIWMCQKIIRHEIKQSFATWMLWAVLDVIVTASIWWNDGSYLLPLVFTIGSAITMGILINEKMTGWSRFETFLMSLVIVCMVIWYFTDAAVATIAGTMAVNLAGVPNIREAYREPEKQPVLIWFGFLCANALGVAGGDAWTVQERLYPTCGVIGSGIMAFLSLRRPSPAVQPSEGT
jgi:hypothetical protein